MIISSLKKYRRSIILTNFYKKLINKGDLCFDIGANLGTKSLVFLKLKASVVAYEPQEFCIQRLKKIQKKHSIFRCFQLAIGDSNTQGELKIGNHIEIATLSKKFINYFQNEHVYWKHTSAINIVTLDSQIAKFGIPKFCKIDTEGFEYTILKKLTHSIPVIEFEFTGGFIGETILAINHINSLGKYEYNYILNEHPKWIFKEWGSSKEIKKAIEKLDTKMLHGNIFAKLKK